MQTDLNSIETGNPQQPVTSTLQPGSSNIQPVGSSNQSVTNPQSLGTPAGTSLTVSTSGTSRTEPLPQKTVHSDFTVLIFYFLLYIVAVALIVKLKHLHFHRNSRKK